MLGVGKWGVSVIPLLVGSRLSVQAPPPLATVWTNSPPLHSFAYLH